MRRRWCSRKSWRGRSWSDVPRWSKRGSSGSASPSRPARDFELVNPEDDPRYRSYVQSYIDVAGRHGVTPDAARTVVRTNATVIAALAVIRGEADAMICGVEGRYMSHLRHVREIIGFMPGVSDFAALALMITSKGAYFIADTQVRPNPSAEELAEMAALAAIHVQRFNLKPRSRSCHIPISAAMIPTPRARCAAPPRC